MACGRGSAMTHIPVKVCSIKAARMVEIVILDNIEYSSFNGLILRRDPSLVLL